MTLKEQIKSDLKDVFLNTDEFANEVIWVHNGIQSQPLSAQAFDEFQDFRSPTYRRLFMAYEDVVGIAKNDYFLINGKRYGVVDFNIDEYQQSITIFLNIGKNI